MASTSTVTRLDEHHARDGSVDRVFVRAEMTAAGLAGSRAWEMWLTEDDEVGAYLDAKAAGTLGEHLEALVTERGAEEEQRWREDLERRPPPPQRYTRAEITDLVPPEAEVHIPDHAGGS